jgi:predicted enzyme related to lactoylglutathione lyase
MSIFYNFYDLLPSIFALFLLFNLNSQKMKTTINWFEIPAKNFENAVKFYENLLSTKIEVVEGDGEKMGFFPQETLGIKGAISQAPDFNPSPNGVLINFHYEGDLSEMLKKVEELGGETQIQKTKIDGEDHGYFATFIDCEGNRLGISSNK